MNDIVYVDCEVDYNLDEDNDWDEYEYLDDDEDDFVDEDDDDDSDEYEYLDEDDEDDSDVDEDEKDDLAAENEDYKMQFKNKFRQFKHIMGPFKRETEGGKSGFERYRALLTPRHHHLIRRKSDDTDNNLLKRTRSLFFNNSNYENFSLKSKLFHFSLLRILDLSLVLLEQFPPQILCLIWLRYLELSGYFDIPTDICRLWNLQTFIVNGSPDSNFPEEIWELMQLRHLELRSFMLPHPPRVSVDEQSYSGFPNIHIISGLSLGGCTKEVISGIRNVRKLKVQGHNEDDYESFQEYTFFNSLVDLHQLETLSVTISVSAILRADKPVTIPSAKAFPATLKKLKLCRTGLSWDDLNITGKLPNLEVLKLKFDAVGEEWYPIAEGFSHLKILMIKRSGLKYWKITNDDFPVLERLIIKDCTKLEEIPIEFAETNSLQLIELKGCSPQLKDSVTRIQQEQEDLGNKPVDIRT